MYKIQSTKLQPVCITNTLVNTTELFSRPGFDERVICRRHSDS